MDRVKLEKSMRRSVEELLIEKKHVSMVDLLVKLKYLTQKDYEKWRFGQIEFLEKVCSINLSKLHFIQKKLNEISRELKLKKSLTAYMRYGKGAKMKLRFSKSGDERVEKNYATHHILQSPNLLGNKGIDSDIDLALSSE